MLLSARYRHLQEGRQVRQKNIENGKLGICSRCGFREVRPLELIEFLARVRCACVRARIGDFRQSKGTKPSVRILYFFSSFFWLGHILHAGWLWKGDSSPESPIRSHATFFQIFSGWALVRFRKTILYGNFTAGISLLGPFKVRLGTPPCIRSSIFHFVCVNYPQWSVSRRCRTRRTTSGPHQFSAHSCGVGASFFRWQLRPTPGEIFYAGLQSPPSE